MKNNKKLVIVVANYFEQCSGGAELQAFYLAQIAKRAGWEVFYIFISNGNPFKNSLDINLYPVPKMTLFPSLGNIKLFYGLKIWYFFKKIKPDAIYQRAGSSMTAISALYSRLNDCRMVFHLANDKELAYFQTVNLFKIIEKQLTRFGQKYSEIVIAQTRQQAQIYLSKFKREVNDVIANGHPLPTEFKKYNNEITVVWIGNMKPAKQPELFIRLAYQLKQEVKATFMMVGRIDQYSEQIKKAVMDDVLIAHGELPNEQVNAILEQSHILVNTSKFEGFSNTFIQAWMRQIPVISLNVNPDAVITEHKIGCYSKTFEQLVADTRILIEDHQLRNQLGANAEIYAKSEFSLDNFNGILSYLSKP